MGQGTRDEVLGRLATAVESVTVAHPVRVAGLVGLAESRTQAELIHPRVLPGAQWPLPPPRRVLGKA
jgi:hypothetical protein